MRLRPLPAVLAVAGVAASIGYAAPPPDKGPPQTCRRFDLQGTLTALAASSFTMRPATGSPITVRLKPAAEVFWTGHGTMAGPSSGERVWAKGTVCGSPPDTYTATWVLVRPKPGK